MFRDLPEYEVIRTEELADFKSQGTLLRHKKSGAKIVLLENDDRNKVFNIAFRTPPADSTGVAHILEHSVLCGSKKFPSKDPFVELAKGSLNTFLNAMTYPDKTMYPIASCNMQDFCNLMHVYMDAVFYPNIYQKEEIFRQEGWSYVIEKPEDEIVYNGVVYNEMKGVFSSADDVLEREIMNSLYPDTPYGIESGGDPKNIPDLSYEEFLAFHSRYYHPVNSYIYLYGDMDMAERLEWLDKEYLCNFDVIEIDSQIKSQVPFENMHEVVKEYSVAHEDEEEENTYLSYNLSVGSVLDVKLSNAMSLLEYVLLSAPGAPVKQALLDAGIGKDIEGGYDSGIRQPYFTITAKYCEPEQKDEFLKVIRDTLTEIVEKGVDKRTLLAGINSAEFRYREGDFGSFPKGLMCGIDMFDSWLYDENDPFAYLHQIDVFDELKKEMGTGYFENLIREYLLENSHATLVVLVPKHGLTAKEDERVREKLAAYKASLSTEEIQTLVEKTAKLRAFQETPSTQEELEKIPMISLSDIDKKVEPFVNEERKVGGVPLIYHELDTNGITYLEVFDIIDQDDITDEDLPYLALLRTMLGSVDTKNYGYRELSNEVNIYCGGIYNTFSACADVARPGEYTSYFGIKAKLLSDQLDFVMRMIEEILFTSSFADEKRMYEIIAHQKSRLQSGLTASGHTTAATRAMSHFSKVSRFNDLTSGITYYKVIEDLEANFDERKEFLCEKFRDLLMRVLRKDKLMVSLTAERDMLAPVEEKIAEFAEKLSEKVPGTNEKIHTKNLPGTYAKAEAFATASQVQYVATAGNFRKAGYEYNGALRILKTIMGYEYLWVNVRVQGGAYGCMSGYGRTGDAYFTSYRDPHLGRTLDVYKGIAEYVENFTVDDRDMCKYIIGTISELDTPLTPMLKGARSMAAYLSHVTDEDRQKERDEVLGADQNSIRCLAPVMRAIVDAGQICVVGNEEKIRQNKELFDEIRPLIG